MENHNTKRGFLATLGAFIAAVALMLTGSVAAQAAPPSAPESADVVITKLEQPVGLGAPASGEPQDFGDIKTVPNITFEAFLVEGTQKGGQYDIGTNAGQRWVSELSSPDDVADMIDTDNPSQTGQTDASGVINWAGVPRGLYVVKEAKTAQTPAGVTASPDFFLAVPLTNPSDPNKWLDTIYVYPKNSVVEGSKTVIDGEFGEDVDNYTRSYTVGQNVTWDITADVPRVYDSDTEGFGVPTGFRITDTLNDDQLKLVQDPVVTLGSEELEAGTHYNYEPIADAGAGTTTHQITFTDEGLNLLGTAAAAGDEDLKVKVRLVTEVLTTGEIENSANLYPDNESIVDDTPLPLDPAVIKYGGYQINKVSTQNEADLSGAVFRVYLTEEDALAASDNYLRPSLQPTGEWTTDSNGRVVVDGLRYTAWANGEVQNETVNGQANPNYQTYWLVEVKPLEGHQLLGEPIEFIVDENSATQSSQEIVNSANEGGFELPLTGGSGTVLLTVVGLALLATVLLIARRRRSSAQTN